jgi:hypothetical protein
VNWRCEDKGNENSQRSHEINGCNHDLEVGHRIYDGERNHQKGLTGNQNIGTHRRQTDRRFDLLGMKLQPIDVIDLFH